jgi:type VI secretion system secreted protein VgrG
MMKDISNSEKISANSIPGIARMVQLEIIIKGHIIRHFKHFWLRQSTSTHHRFKLILAGDVLDQAQDHNLEGFRKFLGKRITVVFRYKDVEYLSPERTFVGIITKVAFSQKKMSLGDIVLKGCSPTILMDAAPHFQSFGGDKSVNTASIAGNIFRQSFDTSMFNVRIDTCNHSYIRYSAQYNETHYNYLSRLAEAYGEQFFYDGETLHFGKLPLHEKALTLVYGSSIHEVKVKLSAVYTKPVYFGYNSSNDKMMKGTDMQVRHPGELASQAYELNGNIYRTASLVPVPLNPNIDLDVDDSQKSSRGSAAVKVFTVSGKTMIPFLYPGCVADVEMRKPGTNKTSYFTRVMMTDVLHEVDALGNYCGKFKAIGEGTGFLPRPDFKTPRAEPQLANVISNTDPLGQGRVQVRFQWQEGDSSTHFIRMMSPDAGGTDAVLENRGFVAVPEEGDQVMVGFEYHHPDFPFVLGGMFHGKKARGGGVANHLKSIQTRSGIKILMNDLHKSVTIVDPSGNTYLMDGQGNINVTAPKNMNFTSGENMNFNVGGNMFTNISNDSIINIARNYQFNSNSFKENINTTKSISVLGSLEETTSETWHRAINGNVLIESAGITQILGKIDAKINKA